MIERTLANGTVLTLVDDLSPTDRGMLFMLRARRVEPIKVLLGEVYANRREALTRAVYAATRAEDANVGQDAVERAVEAAMQVWQDNHPTVKAAKLADKWLAGYGHASIADCGDFAFFIDGGSELLANAIQDTPLFNGQWGSTRAIDCGAQKYMDPIGSEASAAVQEGWRAFYRLALVCAAGETRRRHPRKEGQGEAAYEGAVKMRAQDIARGFLSYGLTLNGGWAATLRHAGDRLHWLCGHPAAEVREAALVMLDMARERYPDSGFDRGAVASGVGSRNDREDARAARRAWVAKAAREYTCPPGTPGLMYSTTGRPNDVFFEGGLSTAELEAHAELLATRPQGAPLPWSMTDYGQCWFDMLLDKGSLRDLARHRPLVVRPALLTADHGFEQWYLEQLPGGDVEGEGGYPAETGFALEAAQFVEAQAERVRALTDDPVLRQYYLAMGFKVRTRVTAGLPALVYLLELRGNAKTIHPTLCAKVREMGRLFKAEYPDVAVHMDDSPSDWDDTLRRAGATVTERRS